MHAILVIAPHPDDETLGCGGTLLKHRDAGDRVSCVFMTAMTPAVGYTEERIRARTAEVARVTDAYRFAAVFPIGAAATTLDTLPRRELISALARVVDQVQPTTVYLPHAYDIHADHRVTADVALSAVKMFRAPSVRRVLAYETLSETAFAAPEPSHAFVPTAFSDITPYLDEKIAIMRTYAGELQPHPFPRSAESIRALAVLRGAMAGVQYAEAFMTLRDCW